MSTTSSALVVTADLDKEKALAAFTGDRNAFTDDADDHGTTDAGRLGFSGNTGIWKVGNDEVEVPSQFVFLVTEAMNGWMAWKNNKPIAFHWARIMDRVKLPAEDTLEDHWEGKPKGKRDKETDGWSSVVRVPVRDLNGGAQLDLTLPGEPSYRPIRKLLLAFGQNAKFNIDPKTGRWKMPIVEIDSEAFDGKGGRKFAPVLKIVDWIAEDEMVALQSEVEQEVAVVEEKVVEVVPPKEAAKPAAAGRSGFRRERVGG